MRLGLTLDDLFKKIDLIRSNLMQFNLDWFLDIQITNCYIFLLIKIW